MQFEKVIDDELLFDGGSSAKKKKMEHIEPANCDEEDKCCKCFPLKLGVKFLMLMCLLNGYFMILTS